MWFTLPEDDRAAATGIELVPAAAGRSALIALDDVDMSLWWAPADTVEIVNQFTRRAWRAEPTVHDIHDRLLALVVRA